MNNECQTAWIKIRPDIVSAWSESKLFAKIISRQKNLLLAGKELGKNPYVLDLHIPNFYHVAGFK